MRTLSNVHTVISKSNCQSFRWVLYSNVMDDVVQPTWFNSIVLIRIMFGSDERRTNRIMLAVLYNTWKMNVYIVVHMQNACIFVVCLVLQSHAVSMVLNSTVEDAECRCAASKPVSRVRMAFEHRVKDHHCHSDDERRTICWTGAASHVCPSKCGLSIIVLN